MTWLKDTQVESTPLSTTGGQTWNAAYRCADYLSETAHLWGLGTPGINVLELGSGTGWLGVTMARSLPHAALVCLTEQEDGVPWLQHNVELNKQRGLPLSNVRVVACDWRLYAASGGDGGSSGAAATTNQVTSSINSSSAGGCEPTNCGQQSDCCQDNPAAATAAQAAAAAAAADSVDLRSTQWDFIVGSDLVYNEIGSRCLPQVMAALARPPQFPEAATAASSGADASGFGGTTIFYCHTKHRFDLLDAEFFEQLEACGLQCQEVWEPSAPPPPSSPPYQFPPADLFPEQRIAVFRITKARQGD